MMPFYDFILLCDNILRELLSYIAPFIRVGIFISFPIAMIGGFISYANRLRK